MFFNLLRAAIFACASGQMNIRVKLIELKCHFEFSDISSFKDQKYHYSFALASLYTWETFWAKLLLPILYISLLPLNTVAPSAVAASLGDRCHCCPCCCCCPSASCPCCCHPLLPLLLLLLLPLLLLLLLLLLPLPPGMLRMMINAKTVT